MNDPGQDDRPPSARVDDISSALDALALAVQEALLEHKRAGNPVAVWREGRVVWIQPEDIPEATLEVNGE